METLNKVAVGRVESLGRSRDSDRTGSHAEFFALRFEKESKEIKGCRHGRYTCEVLAERRQLAAWIRMMGQLAQEVG